VTQVRVFFVGGIVAFAVTAFTGGSLHVVVNHGGRLLIVWYVLSFGLAPFYGFSYWLQARDTNLLKAIGLAHLFSAYSYIWLFAGWRALFRVVVGRRGWAKTARTAEVASEPPA
jgi:hypothetical protein